MENKTVDKFRGSILNFAVECAKPLYAKVFGHGRKPWSITKEDLKKYPKNSLGNALSIFLEDHQFSLIPLYERHDVFHVLLGYPPRVIEESGMQFFLLGNGKYTPSVFITVIFSILIIPDQLGYFIKEYRRGKKCLPIGNWDFQYLLNEPIQVLQNQIFRRGNEHIKLHF